MSLTTDDPCGFLTKEEALDAMKLGKKVTREYFSEEEYIYIDASGVIMSEDGYDFREWWDRIEPSIGKSGERCWRIWEER